MRLLFITSVEREAQAIPPALGGRHESQVVVSGVGRVNAACATTEHLLRHGPFDLVLNVGIAGALPDASSTDDALTFPIAIGDVILATHSVYAEEGLISPEGFQDMATLGFPLGDFEGNAVPGDPTTIERLSSALRDKPLRTGCSFRLGCLATVATCSGVDAQALAIARRTGALAEAMEGAAAIHAAGRLKTPAIELRAISNTTGDRPRQVWDIPAALRSLHDAVARLLEAL